ncbi:carbamoyltransferase HypF [soil metagenome]
MSAIVATEGLRIRVRGLVQGVGYRPTVWRLAHEDGIAGDVLNDGEGVLIHAWGETPALDRFVRNLSEQAPPLARVDAVESVPLVREEALAVDGLTDGFTIVPSHAGRVRTGVVPDAATCAACLDDVRDPANRRHRYAFTNCTHCGPRLTIVSTIPYDRAHTSMAPFALCADCRTEYEHPADRRFHAQPNACPVCGPRLTLERLDDPAFDWRAEGVVDEIDAAARLLARGEIVAVKGIGGFHLACDATNESTVARLRERKRRYAKPFALMARNPQVIARYCTLTGPERELLESSAAPIVILDRRAGGLQVAPAVAPGQRTLGFMLPYTPLHHLLLATFDAPLVMTSGNLSDEPQCTSDDEARETLAGIAGFMLGHDRAIVNRVDDSVVRVADGAPRVLRRARGMAPAPFELPDGFANAPELLAMGGELKNTFCLLTGGKALLSQHMGDLEDAATWADYVRNLSLYAGLYEHEPELIAVDLHPEYLASKLGRERADRDGLALEVVQHHHAHIASCMLENDVPLDARPVLGIALDGLGAGADGTIWGGEFLLADYAQFERVGWLTPVRMPGGAQAIHEPWRNAWAHLVAAVGRKRLLSEYRSLPFVEFLHSKPLDAYAALLETGVASPLASSCGRLFDAVAAAVGICRECAHYEGQAAIELEACADAGTLETDDGYRFDISSQAGGALNLGYESFWPALLDDLAGGADAGVVSARFHRGLATALVELAVRLAARASPAPAIALSGGVFQNRLLHEQVAAGLRATGLQVLSQSQVPANDGGLALGQAAVAAARRLQKGN